MKVKLQPIIFIILFSISILPLFPQNITSEWAYSIGGSSDDYGNSITSDNYGNIYTTGRFQDTADFEFGSGITQLISNGSNDIFIHKSDSDGNLIWVKQVEGISNDYGLSITVDDLGNVYTTGAFDETADFDPGPGVYNLTSYGDHNAFILKLNSNGDFIWAKQMEGIGHDGGFSVTIDSSGNVFSTGRFRETVDFNPGVGVTNLTSAGQWDIYIQKLDSNGNFLWVKQMGGINYDAAFSLALDQFGNIYTTGWFSGTVDFDPNIGITNLTAAGSWDIFIQKLDSNGNFVWAKQVGGPLGDIGKSLALDQSGNVYISGYFSETADFDPGSNIYNLTSAGHWDIYILKLNSNGDFIWAKQMGGTYEDSGYAITLDSLGNVYTTGGFKGTADFDPGIGVTNLTSLGDKDIYIVKLDSNGIFNWVRQFGGYSDDEGHDLMIDTYGNVFNIGFFSDTVDFNPETGVNNLYAVGETDIFIQKLSQCTPYIPTPDLVYLPDLISSCSLDSILIPTAYNGCETLIGATTTSFPITGMDTTIISWTYDDGTGNIVTQTQNIIIIEDTIIPIPDTLNLPIISAICDITGVNVPTATDNCSSGIIGSPNVTFPLTDQSITQIIWTYNDGNGNIVTQAQDINWTSIDVSTSINGFTITANNINTSYQWLDCNNNNSPINGENNAAFTAITNGDYAVEITENGCIDTSGCVSISGIGINELIDLKLAVYPNPSSNVFNITFEKELGQALLIISNTLEQLIYTTEIKQASKASIDLKNQPLGVYFLTIKLDKGQKTIQLVKE